MIYTLCLKKGELQESHIKKLAKRKSKYFVSNYLLNEAKKIGYDSTWDAVIYNGVDLGSFHPIVDDNKEVIKRELMVTGKVIGYVGNLVYVKE